EALRSIVDNPGTGIDLFPIEAAISLAKMGSNYGVPLLLQFLSPNVVHDTESYDTCIRAAVELGNLREARA
ncbi:MAG: hypothetical protein NT066_06690, partial [Candidatus Omnitrophica bacterium]|nr:hypothetical protein [Candidatus Omnitrophota bacterium]